MTVKRNYRPYYKARREARVRFLTGFGIFAMLFFAVGFIGYAVFAILDTKPNTNPVNYAFSSPQTRASYISPETVAASWIQPIVPGEDGGASFIEYPQGENITPAALPTPSPRPPAPPIPEEFTALSFYIPENAAAYAEFQRDRPDLHTETVIWMVNAHVHAPRYTQIQINNQPNPLLITPNLRLPNGFAPHQLVSVNNDYDHLHATPETVGAFRMMREAAEEDGFELVVTSAYRTASYQSQLWNGRGRRDGSTARPHHSEHQTGRALDLWGPGGLLDSGGTSSTGQWVSENAHHFGFIIRYRAEATHITGYIHEPWHITYVGIEISAYMYENGILSLEEYVGRNPGAALPAV